MKKTGGISRRQFLAGSVSAAAVSLWANPLLAQAQKSADTPKKMGTRLILLGTGGGPSPKKTRSAPAQVILVNDVPYVIDCGDGVSRQLLLAGVSPAKIGKVFLTHHHSDHNADYGTLILLAWAIGLKTRVDTYGPPPLEKMTKLSLEMNAYDINIRIVDEGRVPLAPLIHPHEFNEGGVVMQDENVKVMATLVNHPPVAPAFAYRFDTPDRSIVISGDTTPSENLIKLAKGADILVHEVIYKQGLAKSIAHIQNAERLLEHIVSSHTTHEDVGKVAKAAGVKTLVLSHLVPSEGSPAASDEVLIKAAKIHFDGEVIVGKDLIEI